MIFSPKKSSKFITRDELLTICLMLSIFVISRIIVSQLGVSTQPDSLEKYKFWQLLDLKELKGDLLRSIFYQHSQPPLYNLLIGIIYKIFDEHMIKVLGLINCLLSLCLYIIMYRMIIDFGGSRFASFVLSTLFIISPQAFFHEYTLVYTLLVAFLIVLATFFLFRYQQKHKFFYAVCFIATICLICLIRSLFHIIFLAGSIGLLLLCYRSDAKKILILGFFSILIVSSVYIKNQIIFGFFGTSSWLGMNMWRIAQNSNIPTLDGKKRYHEFSPLNHYPAAHLINNKQYQDVAVLQAPEKENGTPNFNHYAYIRISKDFQKAALKSISHYTDEYLKHVFWAWLIYLKPSWHVFCGMSGSDIFKRYCQLFSISNATFTLETPSDIDLHYLKILFPKIKYHLVSLIGRGLAILAVIFWFSLGLRNIVFKYDADKAATTLTPMFISMTVLYVAIVGNFLEFGENDRFRSLTDPVLYILFVSTAYSVYKTSVLKGRKRSGLTQK